MPSCIAQPLHQESKDFSCQVVQSRDLLEYSRAKHRQKPWNVGTSKEKDQFRCWWQLISQRLETKNNSALPKLNKKTGILANSGNVVSFFHGISAHRIFFRYLQQLTSRLSRPPRFEDAAFEDMFENVNKSRRPSTSLAQPCQTKAATEAFHDGRPKREICFAADVLSQHEAWQGDQNYNFS